MITEAERKDFAAAATLIEKELPLMAITEPAAVPAPSPSNARLDETVRAAAHTGITGSARLLDRLDDLARQMTERELSDLVIHAAHILESRKVAA